MRSLTSLSLFLFLCHMTIGAEALEQSGRERTFARALELLEHAKTPDEFLKAAAEFELMLEGGYMNGGVYYNIGNAYMRAGSYGKAIAAYRKAALFRPRDPYLDANLRQALMNAPGRLPEAPPQWWTNVLFWASFVSYPEKVYLAFGGWALGSILAMAGLFLRNRKAYWASGAAVLVAILLSADAALAYEDVYHSKRAYVTRETTALKGNSAEYQPAFDKALKDGAEFTILDRRGEWVLGHFEGIGDGWLKENSIAQ